MTRTQQITRTAGLFRWLTDAVCVAVPLAVLAALLTGAIDDALIRDHFAHLVLPDRFTALQWAAVALVAGAGVVLVLAILVNLRQLFDSYAQGDIHGRLPAIAIRRVGLGLFALCALRILGQTAIVLARTATNPPGSRTLAIALSSADLFLVLAAGLLIVIGWVLGSAADLAEENAGFI